MDLKLNEYVEHRGFFMPVMDYIHCKLHINPELEFIIVTKGCLKSVINGKEVEVREGECCLIFPFYAHSLEKMSEDTEICVMLFPEFVSGEFAQKYMYRTDRSVFELSEHCYRYVLSVAKYVKGSDESLIKSLFYSLAAEYEGAIAEIDTKSNRSDVFGKIIRYLYKNREKSVRLSDLAKTFEVSERTLNRLFEANMGVKPIEYFNDLKINRACVLIAENELSISEVAYECGFSSIRTFNRIFSKKKGCTPTEYKKHIF